MSNPRRLSRRFTYEPYIARNTAKKKSQEKSSIFVQRPFLSEEKRLAELKRLQNKNEFQQQVLGQTPGEQNLVQQKEPGTSNIEKLREMLSEFNIPESQVINLLAELNDAEKRTVINDGWYKKRMVRAFNFDEMVQAMVNLDPSLSVKLTWLDEVAIMTRAIKYSEIKDFIVKAPQTERNALKTTQWRDFFMKVCDNQTIITAVKDLNFDPLTRIEWILEEGNASAWVFGGIDPSQVYDALQSEFSGEALQFIELASLNKWKPEDQKRLRQIMDSQRDDRPAYKDKLGNQAKKLDDPANKLIEKYTVVYGKHGQHSILKTKALAQDLSTTIQTNPALVRQVLDILTATTHKDDHVAVLTLEAISDDEILKKIAQNENGRELLLTMVKKLYKGINTGDEEKQQTRVLQIISDLDGAKREKQGGTTEVEVITFLYGGKKLDAIGEKIGHLRGHTALVIGGFVYSFEAAGWSCGHTKASYLAEPNNVIRDGIGQVLEVTKEDANKLQANLNKSCGTGWYAVSGEICTGASSQALEKALKQEVKEVENPQLFVSYLEATGFVKGRRFYPKKR